MMDLTYSINLISKPKIQLCLTSVYGHLYDSIVQNTLLLSTAVFSGFSNPENPNAFEIELL